MTPELPSRGGCRFVTDGGLETDLIFHHGIDLPDFAVFPLVEHEGGRAILRDYYRPYVDVARRADAGIVLETGTWRANPDWGARLGYAADQLHAVNMEFVRFLQELRDRSCSDLPQAVVSGMIGPCGDGYRPADVSVEAARAYHRPQLNAFAEAGADLAGAYTMATASEALGISRAARDVGIPVAISFTVETDGRLPDGTSLAASIEQVERAAPPAYYLLNCAHPDHLARALSDAGPWCDRIIGTRVNASRLSHAELDEAEALDDGDPADLAAAHARLEPTLGTPTIVGGCCGTDVRHVAQLWGVPAPAVAGR